MARDWPRRVRRSRLVRGRSRSEAPRGRRQRGNAARVIAGLRSQLKACYARDTSTGTGSIRFGVMVGSSGAVTDVSPQLNGSVAPSVIGCAAAAIAAIRQAKFSPPESGTATIQFPAVFMIEGVSTDGTPHRPPPEAPRPRTRRSDWR